MPKKPGKAKTEEELPPGHKLQRSRSGKTMVILPPGLQNWQHPADLVEAFDGIKQEELDELDDYLMGRMPGPAPAEIPLLGLLGRKRRRR